MTPTPNRTPGLSLASKLSFLVGLPIALAVAIGALGAVGTMHMHEQIADVAECQLPATRHMALLDMNHDGLMGCAYRALAVAAAGDAAPLADVVQEAQAFQGAFHEHLDALRRLPLRSATMHALVEVEPVVKQYAVDGLTLVGVAAKDGVAAARALLPGFQASFDTLEEALGKLGERIEQDAAEASTNAVGTAATVRMELLATTLAGTLLAAIVCLYTSRRLARRVADLANVTRRVADGDLTVATAQHGRDEIAQLATAIDTMTSSLRRTTVDAKNNAQSGLQ